MLEQKLKQLLIIVVFSIVLLLINLRTVEGQLLFLVLPIAVIGFVALVKARQYWYNLIIVLTSLTGAVPLMMRFSYWEVVAGLVVVMWIGELAIHKTNQRQLQGRFLWLMICGYCGILIWHVVANRFGIMTYTQGGKRLALTAALVIMVCYLIQSRRFDGSAFTRLPEFGLIPGLFKGGIEIINYLFPAAVYVTYLFYKDINFEVIFNVVSSGRIGVSRLAELRSVGFFLVLLCGVRLAFLKKMTFSFQGFLLMLGILMGLGLTLLAGYRSFFVMAAAAALVCLWVRSPKGAVSALVLGISLVIALMSYQSLGGHLPFAVQRTLSWLPGPWDTYIVVEANRGIEWRMEIWRRFMYFVFPQHPWLGRGQHFVEDESSLAYLFDPYWLFYYGQMLHNGVFSTLDFVGIVGSIFLILASLRAYYCSFVLLAVYRSKLQPWMLWVLAYYLVYQPVYWLTLSFPGYFIAFSICMSSIEIFYRDIVGASQMAPRLEGPALWRSHRIVGS